MRLLSRNRIKNLIAGLFLTVIGLFIVNNVVFLHAHRLSNGKVLIHAHPYNKQQDSGPIKHHNHSPIQIYHISQIQLLFFASCLLIIALLYHKKIYRYINDVSIVHPLLFSHKKGRAPPKTTYFPF